MAKGRIITLTGSRRFLPQFKRAHVELTLLGVSTLTMAMASTGETEGWSAGAKEMADLVYLQHILRSDGVLVLGDGYIGFSGAREITWANMLGVPCQRWYMDLGISVAVDKLDRGSNDEVLANTARRRFLQGPQ